MGILSSAESMLKERAKPPVKELVAQSAVTHEVDEGEHRLSLNTSDEVAGSEIRVYGTATSSANTHHTYLISILGEFGWGGTSVKR